MFSNVTFILNKIKFAEKHNLIPIIDMRNFTTIYNEKTKILSTNNAWEYYFEKLNKYSLHFAYKSKKYYISENKLSGDFSLDILSKKINKYFKLIKFKSYLLKKSKAFIKKNFKKNDKILGVHFRGTTYKVAQKHAFPATSKIMIKHVKKLIRNYDYNKIFISTEEQKYLDIFKKEFKDMCLFTNSFRSTNIDAFKTYPRKKEGIGMGHVEALSYGKYLIAFNDATMNEYILNNKIGFIIDDKNKKVSKKLILNSRSIREKYAINGYKKYIQNKNKIYKLFEKKINFNQNHFIEFKINVSYIFLSINWKLRSILFKLKLI